MRRLLSLLSGLLLAASIVTADVDPPPNYCYPRNVTVSDVALSWTWNCISHCWQLNASASTTFDCSSGDANRCKMCYRWSVENDTHPNGDPDSYAYDTSDRTFCGRSYQDDLFYSRWCLPSGQTQQVWFAAGQVDYLGLCGEDTYASFNHFVTAVTVTPQPPDVDPCF